MAAPAVNITALGIYIAKGRQDEPVSLGTAYDLSQHGFFQRGTIKDFVNFAAKTTLQRTEKGQRQTVKQDNYIVHVQVKDSGLAAIIFVNKNYTARAAFSVLGSVLDDFEQQHGTRWTGVASTSEMAYPLVEQAISKYQDPLAADKLGKIQKDLDDTKIVLHQTIDSLLERGEKLENLVDKSNDLSLASKMFYKQAKDTNACCKMS